MAGKLTRRAAMGLVLGGGIVSLAETRSFSQLVAGRGVSVSVASDPSNALLGIVDQGPVKKNDRGPMAEFINNAGDPLTITVTLDTPNDGTLFDNEDDSGTSISFTVDPGNSHIADIEAWVTGRISYGISVSSPSLSLETSGSVEAESGNVKGAVVINHPTKDKDFTADTGDNRFEVAKVDVKDVLEPDNLDRVEFRVKEGGSSGTVVGSKDVTFPASTGRYNPNSEEIIPPDSGYSIQSGTLYTMTVKVFDADGNFASETIEDRA